MYYKTFYSDVCIVGGGAAGCSAAITASKQGLNTLLIEKGTTLGGLATNGYVPQIVGWEEGNVKEFIDRLMAMGVASKKPEMPDNRGIFDPEQAKLLLELMVTEYGGRLLYDTTCDGVIVEEGHIKEAVFYCKGRKISVKSRIYIDATGDGDLCFMSGVPYENGCGETAGLNASSTVGTRWAGLDLEKYQNACAEWTEKQIKDGVPASDRVHYAYHLEEEAIKNGDLIHHVGNKVVGIWMAMIPGAPADNMEFCTYVFHSYYTDNTDLENISRQLREQHVLMTHYQRFMRKYIPGFENIRLTGIGSLPGARDGRRIFGEYMLKDSDVTCGVKFEDGIARFPEILDTHHPTSYKLIFQRHIHMTKPFGTAVTRESRCDIEMHPFGQPAGDEARPDPRDYCEIPYRCLVPKGVDNLLAVGRCASAQFHANTAVRLIAPAMSTGQAAGVAANLIIEKGLNACRDLDGREVRNALKDFGVNLDIVPEDCHWAKVFAKDGTPFVTAADTIALK